MSKELLNLPPFYIGQKAVCVDDKFGTNGEVAAIKLGDVYVIKAVRKFCCNWTVDIGKRCVGFAICSSCGKEENEINNIHWLRASRFLPIEENFIAIEFEKVIEQEQKLVCVN